MRNNFQNRLNEILADNKSGSSDLVSAIILLLKEKLIAGESVEEEIKIISERLHEFAIIDSLMKNLKNTPVSERLVLLNKFKKEQSSVYKIIYEKLKPRLENAPVITTLSNSRTIVEIMELIFLDFPSVSVYVSESRPVNEGVIMGETLADIGLDVTIVTEAMLPEFVSRSDFALVGADKILSNGKVINKVGSRLLAILCGFYGKPFYVAADKRKFTDDKLFIQKPHPSDEIYSSESSQIKVAENFYFETIDAELITGIFTN